MKSCRLLVLLCLLASMTRAQSRYFPSKIAREIMFDGQLKEIVWLQTAAITNFIQADPVAGNPPTEKTVCRFVYNDEYLFMGVKVFDSEPSKIIANAMERDALGIDDVVALILDTRRDKSNGLVFVGSSSGARLDMEISEDGNIENALFNTFWDLEIHFDSTGYEMEFRVPFSSLRFTSADTVTMGFRLVRAVTRKNEWDIYPPENPSAINIWNKVSLADEIVFTQLRSRKPFYLVPYVTANYSDWNSLNGSNNSYERHTEWMTGKNYSSSNTLDKILSNIGVDMKYGISRNFTLDLTLNTDFSQVEADNYIINLTRFDINLPEKRTFFLESHYFLDFPINDFASVFNSRTVGIEGGHLIPIIAGARLTGKSKGWTVGALNMQTAELNESSVPTNNFSVIRLRKDVGKTGSYLGAILTNKISTSDNSIANHVAGLDYFHRVNAVWYGRAHFSVSKDKDKNLSAGNLEAGFYLAQDKKTGFTNRFSMEAVAANYYPAMGFSPDNDYGIIKSQNSYIWDMNKYGSLNFFTLSNLLSYKWLLKKGTEETFTESPSLSLLFKKGASVTLASYFQKDHIVEPWYFNDDITIPVSAYEMTSIEIMANTNTNKAYSTSVFLRYGEFYGGEIWLMNPTCHFIFSKHFTTDLNYQYTQIKFPKTYAHNHGPVSVAHLLSVKFGYFISSKLNVKLLAQYDSENRQFGANLRFRYNPREGTDLYLVVNQNLNTRIRSSGLSPHPPALDNQSVIIKFVRTLNL